MSKKFDPEVFGGRWLSDEEVESIEAQPRSPQEFDPTAYGGQWIEEETGAIRELFDKGVDAARAIGGGVTGGFSDELAGMTGALGDRALQAIGVLDSSDESLRELYQQYRDHARGELADARERSPIISTIGEVAGGFALPMARVARGAGQILGGARRGAAATSAGAGAAYAAGLSEADLTTAEGRQDLMQDMAIGGVAGGALGALLPSPSAAVRRPEKLPPGIIEKGRQALDEAVEISPLFKSMRDAYRFGKRGDKVVGQGALREVQDAFTQYGERIGGNLFDIGTELAQAQRKILRESGQHVDMGDLFMMMKMGAQTLPQDVAGSIADSRQLNRMAEAFQRKYNLDRLAPEQANMIFQRLKGMERLPSAQRMAAPFKDEQTVPVLRGLRQEVGRRIERHVPEIKGANQAIGAFNETMEGLGLGDVNNTFLTLKDRLDIGKKLYQTFQKASDIGESAGLARRQVNLLLEAVAKHKPHLAEQIKNEAIDLTTRLSIAKRSSGATQIGKIWLPIQTKAIAASNYLGLAVKRISELPPEQLQHMSRIARDTGGQIGERLSRSLERMRDLPFEKRKALMFGIMQNPAYRELLGVTELEHQTKEQGRDVIGFEDAWDRELKEQEK